MIVWVADCSPENLIVKQRDRAVVIGKTHVAREFSGGRQRLLGVESSPRNFPEGGVASRGARGGPGAHLAGAVATTTWTE